jgi:hypothetical protein
VLFLLEQPDMQAMLGATLYSILFDDVMSVISDHWRLSKTHTSLLLLKGTKPLGDLLAFCIFFYLFQVKWNI